MGIAKLIFSVASGAAALKSEYIRQFDDPEIRAGVLGRKFEDLSHGSKQKVGLVQAFMHEPDLLILDEPTLGLDPLMQREF